MLTKEENILINIQTISFFSSALAGIFLQIYIFKLTGFVGVVLYSLFFYINLLIFYILSGFLLRKYSTKMLIKSGLLITSFAYCILIMLKQNAIFYLIPLGLIGGAAGGLYWSGFNLSQYILTHSHSRDDYFGKSMAFFSVASSIGPVIGGFIVVFFNNSISLSYVGYYVLFLIVLLINLFLFFFADSIPSHSGIEFSFRDLLSQKSARWKAVLIQNFFIGLWDIAFITLSSIVIFQIIQDESVVGIARSLMILLTAVTSFFAGKIIKRFKYSYVWGSICVSISIIGFALFHNWMGIVILGVLSGLGSPFMNIVLSSTVLNAIDDNKEPWSRKYHMFIERDGILGIARVLSYGVLLLLFTVFDKNQVARNWTFVVSIFPILLAYLTFTIKKND